MQNVAWVPPRPCGFAVEPLWCNPGGGEERRPNIGGLGCWEKKRGWELRTGSQVGGGVFLKVGALHTIEGKEQGGTTWVWNDVQLFSGAIQPSKPRESPEAHWWGRPQVKKRGKWGNSALNKKG